MRLLGCKIPSAVINSRVQTVLRLIIYYSAYCISGLFSFSELKTPAARRRAPVYPTTLHVDTAAPRAGFLFRPGMERKALIRIFGIIKIF